MKHASATALLIWSLLHPYHAGAQEPYSSADTCAGALTASARSFGYELPGEYRSVTITPLGTGSTAVATDLRRALPVVRGGGVPVIVTLNVTTDAAADGRTTHVVAGYWGEHRVGCQIVQMPAGK